MLTLFWLAVGYLRNHQQTPHNTPEEQRCQLHCSKSPKSHNHPKCWNKILILTTWLLVVFLSFSRLTRDEMFTDNNTAALSHNYCCHGNSIMSSLLSSCYKLQPTKLLSNALPWKSNNDLW